MVTTESRPQRYDPSLRTLEREYEWQYGKKPRWGRSPAVPWVLTAIGLGLLSYLLAGLWPLATVVASVIQTFVWFGAAARAQTTGGKVVLWLIVAFNVVGWLNFIGVVEIL